MPSLDSLSRRQLLRAAGGLSFVAGSVLTAPGAAPAETLGDTPASPSAPPIFYALPYLQPGPDPKTPSLVVAWQTDTVAASFELAVENRPPIVPERAERISDNDGAFRFNYAASVTGLEFGKRYSYSVRMNGAEVARGWFTARKGRGQKTRFVAFGDNSYGDISDRMIAFQTFVARPDFVMNTGDNVYEDGSDSEYARHFFPVYNCEAAGPRLGAPLLRAVPFYTVIANHDVHGKDAKKGPCADFATIPDSLAYFTNMYLPENGFSGNTPPPMIGPDEPIAHFRKCAGARFPLMANYSFDYGDAHFLCLDSNVYVDTNSPALRAYIEKDLSETDATWKFVVFHHPGFNVGADHYNQQHMRVLSPLFEKHGVTLVFHGHEHNYQRTRPMKFAPTDTSAGSKVGVKDRYVPGKFTVDRAFDGVTKTRPDGVMYVTTGAGGKGLYDTDWGQTARTHKEDNDIDYVARFVADRHSLTLIDCDRKNVVLTQIDQWGGVLEKIRITK